MKKQQEVIFESPDSGKTVYARKSGETARHLHSADIVWEKEQRLNERWTKLRNAVHLADTDPTLDDAIKKVEMLYLLKKG